VVRGDFALERTFLLNESQVVCTLVRSSSQIRIGGAKLYIFSFFGLIQLLYGSLLDERQFLFLIQSKHGERLIFELLIDHIFLNIFLLVSLKLLTLELRSELLFPNEFGLLLNLLLLLRVEALRHLLEFLDH